MHLFVLLIAYMFSQWVVLRCKLFKKRNFEFLKSNSRHFNYKFCSQKLRVKNIFLSRGRPPKFDFFTICYIFSRLVYNLYFPDLGANLDRMNLNFIWFTRSCTDIFQRLSSLNFILFLNKSQSFTVSLISSKTLCELMLIEKM